ncbi:hypothetical protein EDB85DRAFT_1898658 [Lactarius pseudohatsudake]|nr:hypothetical protein EDB85DRAFT_1898658 [Lactarius pseudohatsudake]
MASLVTTSISRNGLDQVFGAQRSPRFLCYFFSDKARYHSCTSWNCKAHGITHVRFIKLFMYAITSRIWTLCAIVKAVKQVSRRWPMAVSGWFALTNLLIDLPVMFTGTVEVGEVCWYDQSLRPSDGHVPLPGLRPGTSWNLPPALVLIAASSEHQAFHTSTHPFPVSISLFASSPSADRHCVVALQASSLIGSSDRFRAALSVSGTGAPFF